MLDDDYIQLITRYNQIAESDAFDVVDLLSSAQLILFVITLELEFLSDDDVGRAITKFIAYDKRRLMKSNFMKELKIIIADEKVPRILNILGFNLDATLEEGYELIGLTAYQRTSINFVTEIGKKQVDKLISDLPAGFHLYVRALYITNTYASEVAAGIHDLLTETWEDALPPERLAERPFAYESPFTTDVKDDGEKSYDYFDIPDEQLAASKVLEEKVAKEKEQE